jgi:VWFA-related protein
MVRGLTLTVVLCTGVFLMARQSPTFRGQIDVVQLDVSVLDRDRHPVRGLSPADFTVIEDGVPQSIVAFQAFDIPDPVIPKTTWMREVAPDITTNRPLAGRLVVVVLDDLSQQTSQYWTDYWSAATSTRVIDTIMNLLGPDDLVSVAYTGDNDRAQDFTADRARIRAAISSFTARRPSITFNRDKGSCGQAPATPQILVMDELLRVAAALQSEPQRRKTILFVSPGVLIRANFRGEPRLRDDCAPTLERALFRDAQRANINIYAIDPGGPPPRNLNALDDLKFLAESTGGRFIPDSRNDDPETRVPGIFEENSSYYLIGFRSTNPVANGEFRRIDVKVNRPGVEVRTRSGYYAGGPAAKSASKKPSAPPSPLDESVFGVLPMSETPLRMNVAAFSTPGKPGAALAVVLGVQQPASDAGAGGPMLNVVAHAYDLDGNSVAMKRTAIDLGGQPGGAGMAQYDVLLRLDVPPGRYEIRVGAETSTKRRGSVYGYVDVPKFSNDGLWVSSPLLERAPALPAAAKHALISLLPIVPTTAREFGRNDSARAFLRIYEGGRGRLAPAQVAARVVNADDEAVFEDAATIGVDRFGDERATDYTLALPLARLVGGEYLLRVDTTVGALHQRREIRFSVR